MALWLLACLWHVGQFRTLAYSQPFAFLYKNLKLLHNLRLFVYFALFNDQVIALGEYIPFLQHFFFLHLYK